MGKPSGQHGYERPHPGPPAHVRVDSSVDGVWVVHLPNLFHGITPQDLEQLLERYVDGGHGLDKGPLVLEPTPELEAISPPLGRVYERCPHGRHFGGFYCEDCATELDKLREA